jgi:ABC-type nitrate/sulfonate/bicarbonate transport system permease component
LVAFVSAFPIIYNSWTGVKAVKEIWLRSAQAMGADDRRLFRHVVLPGALPYIVTGLRLGLARGAFWSQSKCSPPFRGDWAG